MFTMCAALVADSVGGCVSGGMCGVGVCVLAFVVCLGCMSRSVVCVAGVVGCRGICRFV